MSFSFVQKSPGFFQLKRKLQFSRRTPFDVVRFLLVIIGAVAASDLRASELDGFLVVCKSVRGQHRWSKVRTRLDWIFENQRCQREQSTHTMN